MENIEQILRIVDGGGSFALLVFITYFFYSENNKLRAEIETIRAQNKELEVTIAKVQGKQEFADDILVKLTRIESKL